MLGMTIPEEPVLPDPVIPDDPEEEDPEEFEDDDEDVISIAGSDE